MAVLGWAGFTNVGKVRAQNEDQFLADPPVFLVADGMGGHDCGEVASALVADAFLALAGHDCIEIDRIERAVLDANAAVRRAAAHSAGRNAMGTTLVALVLAGESGSERWVAVNVGDSRLYRLSSGVLEQITTDHSVVQELVAAGSITVSEARTHPDRNVVTRAVGISDGVVADFAFLEVREGDRFLLCSDGVHGELTNEQLRVLLGRAGDADEVVKVVGEAVLRGEARDNLTAVVVDVLRTDSSLEGVTEANEDTSPLNEDTGITGGPDLGEGLTGRQERSSPDTGDEPPVVEIMALPDSVRVALPSTDESTHDDPGGIIEVPEW